VFTGETFTYDANGLVATRAVAGEGTYTYEYDALGRNTRLTYPDGHVRTEDFYDTGRIRSRCYLYPNTAFADRCYGAVYDRSGAITRLSDPEGTDVISTDAIGRLLSVTRQTGGGDQAVESYGYNELSALATNAGAAVDAQRPRLD